MPSAEVISQDERRISVRLKGVPRQYANALRRICLNDVPVFAVDTVSVIANTSVMADEALAHRLGLVPLRTDLSEFGDPSKADVGASSNRVMLVLDAPESDETRTVTSGDISSEDPHVRPVSGSIPLVVLAPGQAVKVEAYARLGRGREHAKWNASNVSVLTDTDEDGQSVLTVESSGAADPAQVVLAGAAQLSHRIAEFREGLGRLGGA